MRTFDYVISIMIICTIVMVRLQIMPIMYAQSTIESSFFVFFMANYLSALVGEPPPSESSECYRCSPVGAIPLEAVDYHHSFFFLNLHKNIHIPVFKIQRTRQRICKMSLISIKYTPFN